MYTFEKKIFFLTVSQRNQTKMTTGNVSDNQISKIKYNIESVILDIGQKVVKQGLFHFLSSLSYTRK